MPLCRLGGPLAKTLRVLKPISRRYKLSSALKDVDGREIGQRDAVFHQTPTLQCGHVIAELHESIERQSPTILEHRCKQSCSILLQELGCQQVSACYTPVGNLLDVETQACRRASMVLALRLQLSSWRGVWLCCIVRGCDHNGGEMRHIIAKVGVLVTPLSPPVSQYLMLRNAHLNTKTITKTCSKLVFKGGTLSVKVPCVLKIAPN